MSVNKERDKGWAQYNKWSYVPFYWYHSFIILLLMLLLFCNMFPCMFSDKSNAMKEVEKVCRMLCTVIRTLYSP